MTLPPLISPGPELSPAERQRYARQLSLPQIGELGQRRLGAARVLMLGAGGLGSPVLTALAAAGVGTIGIVDSDSVEISNLSRQTIYSMADLGLSKAEAAAANLRAQNPLVTVVPHAVRLTAANVLTIVAEYDIVIDGTDNFDTRHLAHDAAALLGKPYVWGSVLRFDGQVTVFWATAPTTPVTLSDLFPETPALNEAETCAVAGVLGSVCAGIGAAMATETLKLIVGFGDVLLGRLLVHDGLEGSWREIAFGRGDSRAALPLNSEAPAADAPAADAPLDRAATPLPVPEPVLPDFAIGIMPEFVSSAQLAGLLEQRVRGDVDFVLVDIREPWEREIVAIDGSVLVPLASLLSDAAREVMPPDENVVLYCHHGSRSDYARQVLDQNGWSSVTHLDGGVDAWSLTIDPAKQRY
jgi:molybdopterin/thiamine biosynthesis adenylyltransferase/rhodanese-related sulfurtransferase